MTKHPFILLAVCIIGVWIMLLAWWLTPLFRGFYQDHSQRRSLQSRVDYPQIAAACVTISHSATNEEEIEPSDPRVPASIRALSPFYIVTATNGLTMEFHGGFDHYGYRLRQSTPAPKQWMLYFYDEQGEKPLTMITND